MTNEELKRALDRLWEKAKRDANKPITYAEIAEMVRYGKSEQVRKFWSGKRD